MKQMAMRHFQEDEVILEQGSTAREMYKILSGKAAVYLHYGQQEEYLVGVLSEQRCFGELTILCGKPSPYTVVAFTEVLVLCITEDTFDDFIKNNTDNAIGVMKNLAGTVDTLSTSLKMLNDDLMTICSERNDTDRMQDITRHVRECAALEAISKTLFTTLV